MPVWRAFCKLAVPTPRRGEGRQVPNESNRNPVDSMLKPPDFTLTALADADQFSEPHIMVFYKPMDDQ